MDQPALVDLRRRTERSARDRLNAVPLLDLEDFRSKDDMRRKQFNADLRHALTKFGFVRIVGHEVDASLIRCVYEGFEEFFARDEEEKAVYSGAVGGQRGFTPVGVEHAKDQATPDLKEFFHVGRELPPTHAYFSEYPPNLWPSDAAPLRRACLDLYDALDRCAVALLESLALGFDLPRDAFARMLTDGNSILRALHYPPVELQNEAAMRAAPHEDINLITLLCEATSTGLEILTRDDEWLAIPAHPGEIIVDAGDMLSRITNDVVPSATHRVIAAPHTAEAHRYSLPYFAHPFPSCDLSVRDSFVEPGAQPKYPTITAAQFLNQRLREIGLID
jgi:isopenicillin N synthase-like dioxygenase